MLNRGLGEDAADVAMPHRAVPFQPVLGLHGSAGGDFKQRRQMNCLIITVFVTPISRVQTIACDVNDVARQIA